MESEVGGDTKKTRIKRALGQLKELMVKKRVTLKDEPGYNLMEKVREGEVVRYYCHNDRVGGQQGGFEVRVVEPAREITLEELVATLSSPVDNTGNTRTWPSEELLAHYYLSLQGTTNETKKDFSVCELGAGMSGLAGWCAAASGGPHRVDVSDGNEECVKSKTLLVLKE